MQINPFRWCTSVGRRQVYRYAQSRGSAKSGCRAGGGVPKILCASTSAVVVAGKQADALINTWGIDNSEVAWLVHVYAGNTCYEASKLSQPSEGKGLSAVMCVLIRAFCLEESSLSLLQKIKTRNLRIEKRHAGS